MQSEGRIAQKRYKCWIEYIAEQRDKKKMQLFLGVLLNYSRGNPGRHWDDEQTPRGNAETAMETRPFRPVRDI